MRILNVIIAFILITPVIGQDASRLALLDQYLEQSVAEGIIPGGVFKVNLHGKEIFSKTVGFVDIEKTKAYQEDDLFRIASMTKAITVTAIMQLYENGQLLIDDPLSDYIPAFTETKVLDAFNEADSTYTVKDLDHELTLRHLLTHTSGIYYGSFVQGNLRAVYMKNNAMNYGLAHPELTTEQMADHIATLPLAHQPGTKWTYGLNMEVLGRVVEVVSGMSLDAYFKKHIFDPLKMNDTHFYVPFEKHDRIGPVFMQLKSGTIISPDPNMDFPKMGPFDHFAGGGGLTSTASDYMRFVQAMLNGGALDGARILGSRTIEQIKSPQTAYLAQPAKEHTRSKGNGFGLGYQVYTEDSKGAVPFSPGTYSWGGYFNTKFWIDPTEQLGFVGMTQVVPFEHGEFWDKLYSIIYSSLDDTQSMSAEYAGDKALIHAAISDYVEGLYQVDSTRIERSVHPDLRKRGFWYNNEEKKYYDNLNMTFKQLRHLAATWNVDGSMANSESIKRIEILDIHDKTASGKLTAVWGIDRFQLSKMNGRWYIMNIVWESIVE